MTSSLRLDDLPATTKVYLAGPMSGYVNHNFPAFNEAASLLRAIYGFNVLNPAEFDDDDDSPTARKYTWEQYMRRDIANLILCDVVVVLPGWEQSKGASLEVQLANGLNMPVYSMEARELLIFPWRAQAMSPAVLAESKVINLKWDAAHFAREVPIDTVTNTIEPNHTRHESICHEAHRLVHGNRQAAYSHPADNFRIIADLWAPIIKANFDKLGHYVALNECMLPPELVGLMMMQVKVARELHSPKRDNRVDMAGYAETVQLVHEARGGGNA